jgi:hypothetical protein
MAGPGRAGGSPPPRSGILSCHDPRLGPQFVHLRLSKRYNGGVALTPCPRPHCGGTILFGTCLLCARSLTPPTVGGRRHREAAARRAPREDPYVAVARKVLRMPEAAPMWDEAQQAYVIDELDG